MIIRYIKHNQIDKNKWDSCIENSVNGMIYGMSWYLDTICENWDALVSDDYEAIMPLPWKSKFGIKYIYHPFFAQQLGLFYMKDADDQVFEFLEQIPPAFIKYETSINYLNEVKQGSLNIRTNHVLDLNKDYNQLYHNFSENTRRNIKKAAKAEIKVTTEVSIDEFLTLKQLNNINDLTDNHFSILKKLFGLLIEKEHAQILGVKNPDGVLTGAAIFVNFRHRVIYLFSASSEVGKENSAMFAIVNHKIQELAGQNKILDFEGSMIEGVARFFKGFGAVTETYYRATKSRIPFIK